MVWRLGLSSLPLARDEFPMVVAEATYRKVSAVRSPPTIFRDEALAYHVRGNRTQGDLLRIAPRWTHWTYWLLVAVCVAGSTYIVCGRLNAYATGLAVIRDEGRTMVTASTGGTITSIAVQPGQYVEAQQVLLRLNDVQETIELERLQKEFHVQQINRLKNPHDLVAQQQLATLRAQTEAAEQRLKERTIAAPRAGIVRDLRIRPHQLVASGELLLTIVGDKDVLSVVAMLPGQYRPLLK